MGDMADWVNDDTPEEIYYDGPEREDEDGVVDMTGTIEPAEFNDIMDKLMSEEAENDWK